MITTAQRSVGREILLPFMPTTSEPIEDCGRKLDSKDASICGHSHIGADEFKDD